MYDIKAVLAFFFSGMVTGFENTLKIQNTNTVWHGFKHWDMLKLVSLEAGWKFLLPYNNIDTNIVWYRSAWTVSFFCEKNYKFSKLDNY